MDHIDLEELSDAKNSELQEILPTLNAAEASDLRDLLYARLTKITIQLRGEVRHHSDGSQLTPEEYRSWRCRAIDARAHINVAFRLVKTHINKLRVEEYNYHEEKAERYRKVHLGGTLELFQEVYEIARRSVSIDDRTEHQRTVMIAAKQVLDNAKRQKVGA